MTKKLQNITNKLAPLGAIIVILLLWFLACDMELVPAYMLPSPIDVVKAFVDNFSIMMKQAAVTLQETFYGLLIGIAIAFVIASLMDRFTIINKALYPVLVVTQTIPTIGNCASFGALDGLWYGSEKSHLLFSQHFSLLQLDFSTDLKAWIPMR